MTIPYTRGDSFSGGDSREHIKRALVGYGATDVLFSQRGHRSAIAFRGGGRQFRIVLSLSQSDEIPLGRGDTAEGPVREAKSKVIERANRRSWHALALAIDAKLAAVAAGISTLESEFLAHVVLPGNRTVFDELEPVIDSAYRSGRRPLFGDSAPSTSAAAPEIPADVPVLHPVPGPAALGWA